MPRRNQTRLERAAASVGATVAGYATGRNGQSFVRFRDNATGQVTQIPLGRGRGGGSGSMGG